MFSKIIFFLSLSLVVSIGGFSQTKIDLPQVDVDIWAKIKKDNKRFLLEQFSKESKLSNSQRQQLADFFISQYQTHGSYQDARYSDPVANFGQVANDNSLSLEQKKTEIKKHRDEIIANARQKLGQGLIK